ncbi:hypothetical protein NCC49_006601 [Naganishia albida]|nr:hypothetical protein NCC49_006601 [Naganishia albida]
MSAEPDQGGPTDGVQEETGRGRAEAMSTAAGNASDLHDTPLDDQANNYDIGESESEFDDSDLGEFMEDDDFDDEDSDEDGESREQNEIRNRMLEAEEELLHQEIEGEEYEAVQNELFRHVFEAVRAARVAAPVATEGRLFSEEASADANAAAVESRYHPTHHVADDELGTIATSEWNEHYYRIYDRMAVKTLNRSEITTDILLQASAARFRTTCDLWYRILTPENREIFRIKLLRGLPQAFVDEVSANGREIPLERVLQTGERLTRALLKKKLNPKGHKRFLDKLRERMKEKKRTDPEWFKAHQKKRQMKRDEKKAQNPNLYKDELKKRKLEKTEHWIEDQDRILKRLRIKELLNPDQYEAQLEGEKLKSRNKRLFGEAAATPVDGGAANAALPAASAAELLGRIMEKRTEQRITNPAAVVTAAQKAHEEFEARQARKAERAKRETALAQHQRTNVEEPSEPQQHAIDIYELLRLRGNMVRLPDGVFRARTILSDGNCAAGAILHLMGRSAGTADV